jgi:hypothetical protein
MSRVNKGKLGVMQLLPNSYVRTYKALEVSQTQSSDATAQTLISHHLSDR